MKQLNILRLLQQWLRSYWSVTTAGSLSVAFRFLWSCLSPLRDVWSAFDTHRKRLDLAARVPFTYGSVEQYIYSLYGEYIVFSVIGSDTTLWPTNDLTQNEVWLGQDPADAGVYLTSSVGGSFGLPIVIVGVPANIYDNAELYERFLYDMQTLSIAGVVLNYKRINS